MQHDPIWCEFKTAFKITVATGALTAAMWSSPVAAQSAPIPAPKTAPSNSDSAESGGSDDILVTGSNIRGNVDTAISLTTVTRDDFERFGFLNVGAALQSLPQNFGGGLTVEGNAIGVTQDRGGINTSIAVSPNLRALGPGATLTLLNGDRLTPAGIGLAVDVSLIPTAAIERVDVLADGASATYGTDAVAGVVNIITRRKYDGIETRALYGGAQDGMETYNGSFLVGGSAGKLNGVLSAEYFSQGALYGSDRSASKNLPVPYTIIPSQKRYSLMASATYDLASSIQIYTDGFFTHSKLDTQYKNSAYTSTGVVTNEQWVVDAGLKAELNSSWHLDLSGRLSESSPVLLSRGVLTSGSTFTTNWDRTSNLRSIQAIADGSLLAIPGGSIKASVGASYRNEEIRSVNTPAAAAKRDVGSAFAELAIPLVSSDMEVPFVNKLFLTAAGRYDSYGGGIGSSFVPKFSGAWQPTKSIEFKATWSRSYRAPSLYENSASYVAYLRTVQDNVAGGTSKALWLQGTGRSLSPEKSNNLDFQLKYTPNWTNGLDVSLGYYRFIYSNRIADPDPNTVAYSDIRNTLPIMLDRSPTGAEVDALIKGASTFGGGDPTGVTVIIDSRFVNVARTYISGLEGRINYVRNIGSSTVNLSSNINYIDKFTDVITPQAGEVSRVGTLFSPPHWKARTTMVWSRSRLSASLAWNYVGSYRDNRIVAGAPGNIPVEAWNTLDLGLTFHLNSDREHDTRLTLVASNLLDAAPPYVANTSALRPANWDPTNASAVGRFVSVELVKKW